MVTGAPEGPMRCPARANSFQFLTVEGEEADGTFERYSRRTTRIVTTMAHMHNTPTATFRKPSPFFTRYALPRLFRAGDRCYSNFLFITVPPDA